MLVSWNGMCSGEFVAKNGVKQGGVISPVLFCIYTVSHNYGNPYEKWNIFVARPHLWLKLGMVKPEIILCETVLNLSTLNTLTYLLTY